MTQRVIFACVANAGRSQMAAALFGRVADPALAVAVSAGTAPASAVHPEVVLAMAELGIDLGDARPRLLDAPLAATANLLVTMGCGESCPVVPGTPVLDWPLADPKGRSIEAVRTIRDQIAVRVEGLVAARGWGRRS